MKDINLTPEHINQLRSVKELRVITITGFKIILSAESEDVGLVFSVHDTEYVIPINRLEATSASYHINGFSKHAHIPDIYSAFMHLVKTLGFTLKHAILEAKSGDVIYGRLVWKDGDGKLLTQIVTPGDVFVFAHTLGVKPGIVATLLEHIQTLDEWPYQYNVDEW